jgi:WD40 repeat protein
MRICSKIWRGAPALGLMLLSGLLVVEEASAQDRYKVEIVRTFPHAGAISTVAFSPNGALALSGSNDNTMKLWDVATGTLVRTFVGHSNWVHSVAFSPDGTRVLSGSRDKTVKLWDAATGALVRTFNGHSREVLSVAFSPDGSRVLSGSIDKTMRLWDAATGATLRTFKGHSAEVTSVAFSPDGTRALSSGSYDKTMKLWNTATGTLLRTFGGHSEAVTSVAFSPDGTRVLSTDWEKAKLWDLATGAHLRTLKGHAKAINSVAYSPDATRVVLGSYSDTTIELWDVATGALVRSTPAKDAWQVSSVAFSPDGTHVLSGGEDKAMKLWDAATGSLVRTFEGQSDGIASVAFSRDGTRLLSGSSDRTTKLWDVATGALLRTFEAHSGWVTSVAFSPDSTRVLSGGGGTVTVWDPANGTPVRNFEEHRLLVSSAAFSPDGFRILIGTTSILYKQINTLTLWDAATGTLVRKFEDESRGFNSIAFSPDGNRILSGSTSFLFEGDTNRTLKLWDVNTGAVVRSFKGHTGAVTSVAFSPDGSRVVSGNADNTVKLSDPTTGAVVRVFEGHSDQVTSVAFSPDGRRIISGSWDRTIRLWDAANGTLARTFKGHSDEVTSVAFSPDGRRIISGGRDGSSRIWDVVIGDERATLIGTRDGQWLAITPLGFFAASPKGSRAVSIVRGLGVTTIAQVHQSLFNPDLVRETLAGDPDGEVREAAKVINLEKVLDSGPAPSVGITSPAGGSHSSSDVATVTARVEDRGKGVGRIEWRVNGVTAAIATKPEGAGPIYTLSRHLALDPGDNTVEVVAYNASNLLASVPARTSVKFTEAANKTRPRLHILAIGIDVYADGKFAPPLDLAEKDATAFAESMHKAAAGLYGQVLPPTLVLGKDATRANLGRVIDRIAADIHPRDTFILFASGHGTSSNGRFYLIPQDYQSGSASLADGAIGQDQLQHWLANRIKARRAIILLDTCQSGALVAGYRRSRIDAPASEAAVGRLHEATGRPVLTAAAVGQDAIEGVAGANGEKHGVFTWAVLDALRKGDTNGDGLIELYELVSHVQSVVPKIAAEMGDKQVARFGSRGENFVVGRRLQ